MSSTTKQSLAERYFKEGAEVEISETEEGLFGSWYNAKIIRLFPKSSSALVEYKDLTEEKNKRIPLQEKIKLTDLRPAPPVEQRLKFNIDDDVDAYYHCGWWEGIIIGFIQKDDKYVVFFKHTREQMAFRVHKLRIHREWVYGKWHPALDSSLVVFDEVPVKSPKAEGPVKSPKAEGPVKSPKADVPASKKRKTQPRDDLSTLPKDVPFPAEMQDVPLPAEMQDVSSPAEMQEVPVSSENTPNKHGLRPGQTVEVCMDEEGFEDAWYSATLLEILNTSKYRIEYEKLESDDRTLLMEEVDSLHIRPCPPDVSIVDRFDTHEYVEASYNDGWWVGKISKVLKDDKYKVYFSGTDEEKKVKHSDLRVHQEWINGRWVIPNKVVEF